MASPSVSTIILQNIAVFRIPQTVAEDGEASIAEQTDQARFI
jgi:hypothetical protein